MTLEDKLDKVHDTLTAHVASEDPRLKSIEDKLDRHIQDHEDLMRQLRKGLIRMSVAIIGAAIVAGLKFGWAWAADHLTWK